MKQKLYREMTADELAEATKDLDKEFVKSQPLTPAMRAEWNRIKRGRGRPKVGEGAKPVLVTIEGGLLRKADRFARKNKLTRSELIARSLHAIMNTRGASAANGKRPSRRKAA